MMGSTKYLEIGNNCKASLGIQHITHVKLLTPSQVGQYVCERNQSCIRLYMGIMCVTKDVLLKWLARIQNANQ